MKWFTELVGILLCVQGVVGGLSAILDGHPSWFLVRRLLPEPAQLPAAIAIALLGALVLVTGSRRRQED
jgi:ABC-type Fe3+-siderophore transport system permease subunit